MLVELQARFDEEANIRWARALEEVGAHVVYGLVGLQDALQGLPGGAPGGRRHPPILPPGDRQLQRPDRGHLRATSASSPPGDLRRGPHRALQPADRLHPARPAPPPDGGAHRHAGRPHRAHPARGRARPGPAGRPHDRQGERLGRPRLIEELYAAGAAGVHIDLIVRGICCLRPGVPGCRRAFGAVSIIDRYLEHAACSSSRTGGSPEYLLASADWMPRNLDGRVEVAFPVLDRRAPGRRSATCWRSSSPTPSRRGGSWPTADRRACAPAARPPVRSQERLYALAGAARRARAGPIPSGCPRPEPRPDSPRQARPRRRYRLVT